MEFHQRQLEFYNKRYGERHPQDVPPECFAPHIELLTVGQQQDSKYAVFIEHDYWMGKRLVFSYPSLPIPFPFSYWCKKMTKSGWTAEIRAFPKRKLKDLSKKHGIPLDWGTQAKVNV